MSAVATILRILGSLGLFLYGMKILSEGLQKAAGKGLSTILDKMTSSRLRALITGLAITVIIQSSSATTVMVVGFVNAGLMKLIPAIGVIIGANVGTTVTGWIVAILGFKMDITILALASIAVSLPMMFSSKEKTKEISEIFLGFGLLFLGLEFLKSSMPDISGNIKLLSFLSKFNTGSLGSILICVLLGTVLTVVVQSSSAAMALTLAISYQGWIGVNAAAALVLGQNIGTTITAYIASIGATSNAKRSAWAHIIFNIVGSIIAIVFFHPFLKLVNYIIPGDIYTLTGDELAHSLPMFLAAFHTSFNILNAILFFPFIPQFAHLIERFIPEKKETEKERYVFRYVNNPLFDAPELFTMSVKNEIRKMTALASEMFSMCISLLENKEKDPSAVVKVIKEKEDWGDQMQDTLTDAVVKMLKDTQMPTNAGEASKLLRVIDELESVTDSCCDIAILSERRYQNGWVFPDEIQNRINEFALLVQTFLSFVEDKANTSFSQDELQYAEALEASVDNRRDDLKEFIQQRLVNGSENVKIDLLALEEAKHLEHVGDYLINVAQAYAKH